MVVIPGRLFVLITGYNQWFGSFDLLETFSIERITFFLRVSPRWLFFGLKIRRLVFYSASMISKREWSVQLGPGLFASECWWSRC